MDYMTKKQKQNKPADFESCLSSLLTELKDLIKVIERKDKTKIYTFRDDCPIGEDFKTLNYAIHTDLNGGSLLFPNDWIYETLADLIYSISGYTIKDADSLKDYSNEIADSHTEIYNSKILHWLGANQFAADCYDEYARDGIINTAELIPALRATQCLIINQIYDSLAYWMIERIEKQLAESEL